MPNNLQTAPKGNDGFLVPETFSLEHPVGKSRHRGQDTVAVEFETSSMVELLEEVCSAEWGEWPKPVDVSIQNGEWLFRARKLGRFRNIEEQLMRPPHQPIGLGLGNNLFLLDATEIIDKGLLTGSPSDVIPVHIAIAPDGHVSWAVRFDFFRAVNCLVDSAFRKNTRVMFSELCQIGRWRL